MGRTVVFIHHERTVLRTFERLVDDQSYFKAFFRSSLEAIDYVKKHPVHMVIVNKETTDLTSEVFLEKVQKINSDIIRIMFCDITDVKSVTRLIEKGLVKQLLVSPWHDSEIKRQINSLLSLEVGLLENKTLSQLVNLEDLPSLPELYQSLMRLMSKSADIDLVGELISKDQSIALKVLGLANSAFYGRKTGNINQAIMSIGLNNVKNIVLANSVFGSSNEHLDLLWQHGVNTNRLILAIYKDVMYKKMPTLFGSIGLLHDVGRVIMYSLAREKYEEIQKLATEGNYVYINLEEEQLGTTHQVLGAYLLSMWELPFVYIEAAMYHHYPMHAKVVNKELVAVLHIANYYALKMMNSDGTHNLLDQRVFEFLEIDRESVETIVKKLMEDQ